MSDPQPRRDKRDVPWCSCHCDSFRNSGGIWCSLQSSVLKVKENTICLPAVIADGKKLADAMELIDKLPKTKDGVAIIPGSSNVWKLTKGVPEKSVNWRGWAATFMSDINESPEWMGGHDPTKCYSTKQAVIDAQGEEK